MSQEKFRLAVVILLSIFVAAFIVLGACFVANGRYVQYDHQKDNLVFGNSTQTRPPSILDTRTGKKLSVE